MNRFITCWRHLRTLITALIVFLVNGLSARAQDDYRAALLDNIYALDTTSTALELTKLANAFGALYEAKQEWQPLYYQCLATVRLSNACPDADRKEDALHQAEKLLAALPGGDHEVLVLRAYFAQAMLAFNRDLWQQYLPMINESLKQAGILNPDNPRVYYLKGIMTYYMPASMGGAKEAGLQLFRKALEKYDYVHPKDA